MYQQTCPPELFGINKCNGLGGVYGQELIEYEDGANWSIWLWLPVEKQDFWGFDDSGMDVTYFVGQYQWESQVYYQYSEPLALLKASTVQVGVAAGLVLMQLFI